VLHSPFTDPGTCPAQPVFAEGVEGTAVLDPGLLGGLLDLEGFSHLHLIYAFHRHEPARLRVVPLLDTVERGVFATRAPWRPNPIGLSLVRLLGVEGNVLRLADVDFLDGSPLLDLKPYVPRFDVRPGARGGWTEGVDPDLARRRGRRRP
jgi:tRNA-Thr(GGU) m(6)t(6)A37 methyltransferase TsaA